ncbi:DUF6350 family protein [Actinotalea sp.]|uniref:cell division protein PerM n=1 Tax=Actinotalea sp. TaxID=1872145 RepID=UPI0035672219
MSRPSVPSARRPGAPAGRPATPTARPPAHPTARPAARPAARSSAAGQGSSRFRAGLYGLSERVGVAVDGYRRTTSAEGAPHWVSGLLAGAQGAFLSFLVVVLPTMAAYVATSADPSNAEVGWPRAAAVGAALWLLGHGGSLVAGGATVTLVPLGLTALSFFAAYASARRTARPTARAWVAFVGGYLVIALAALLVAGAGGPLGAGPIALLRGLGGVLLVAGLGGGAGILGRGALARATARWRERLPAWVRLAVRGGVMCGALLVALAAGLTLLWILQGRAPTDDIVTALDPDPVGGVVMGLAQLAVLPNLVLWAVAWIVGPGFVVGQGTVFSPAEVVGGPMPALPLLGSLPTSAGGVLQAVPVVLVLLGALCGWWWHRRRECRGAWQPAVAALAIGGTGGGVVGVLSLLASGAAGPGRLAVVGAPVLEVAATAALLLAVGAAIVAVPAEGAVRAGVARGARALAGRVRGGSQPPGESSDAQPDTADSSAS